jgi:MFS family permease
MIHYAWVIAATGTLVLLLTQGFVTLFFGIGQCLGPAIAGWIKDMTGTFSWCFVLSAAVSVCGAAGATALKKNTTKTPLRRVSDS